MSAMCERVGHCDSVARMIRSDTCRRNARAEGRIGGTGKNQSHLKMMLFIKLRIGCRQGVMEYPIFW